MRERERESEREKSGEPIIIFSAAGPLSDDSTALNYT